MRSPENKQYYFGIRRRNTLIEYKRPLTVKSQAPQTTEAEPLAIKRKTIDTKVGPGQYTFAHDVWGIRSINEGRKTVIFNIPKSNKDGAELPTIVFPEGLQMINPRLSREVWDEAYLEAMKEIARDEREQIAAYNAMISRRYGRSHLPAGV